MEALLTQPRESMWESLEGHRKAPNSEQDALLLSPFLSCVSFPPAVGKGVTEGWEKAASLLTGPDHRKTKCREVGAQGRWWGGPDRAWRGGWLCGRGWREGPRRQ